MALFIETSKLYEVFRPKTPVITLGMAPKRVATELKVLDGQVTTFTNVAKALATEKGKDSNPEFVTLLKESRVKLLKALLTSAVLDRYRVQLESQDTYEKLTKFLEGVFATQLTDEEKLAEARGELDKLSRFAAENETFEQFLSRLSASGEAIATLTSQETADMLVRDVFARNIPPRAKTFLTEHGKSTAALADKAKFLDEREMHKRTVAVNQLESELVNELRRQNDALVRANTELSAKFDRLSTLVEQNTAYLHAHTGPSVLQLGSDRAPTSRNPNTPARAPNRRGGRGGRGSRAGPRSADWPPKVDTRPGQCSFCGMDGHDAKRCPKPRHISCTECGRVGHVASVCWQKWAKN